MEFTTAMASGTVRMKEHDFIEVFIASLLFGGTNSDEKSITIPPFLALRLYVLIFLCSPLSEQQTIGAN